jgi:PAS domain S-box-containing protein
MSRDELLAEIVAVDDALGGSHRVRDLVQELRVHQEELQVQQTELVEAQRALEDSRDRYADLFDFAPIAFLTVDRSGVVEEANLAAGSLLGAQRDRLPGFPFVVYVAERDRRTFLAHLSTCRRTEQTVQTRLHLRSRDGSEHLVDVVSRPAARPGGREVWHTCLVDVTASEHAEAERRSMEIERLRMQHEEEALRSASETKDRFLAVLSHELRTPLTPILLKLGALEARGAIPDELREPLGLVRRNIEVEARLIDDLLDTTRIVHGKLHMEQICVDVHELLQSLAATVSGELDAAAITLHVDLGAQEFHVRGDALRLRQVFWNLLNNAQRHTPRGGAITVSTTNPKSGCLQVRVADTGSGIEPCLLGRIFEPFEQAEGALRTGLGLGLAISKGIVDAHHGRIRVQSDGPQRGATFEVEIDTIASPAEEAAQVESGARQNGAGLRILLVEDHADSAESLCELLAMYGHDVTIAACFAEAAQRRGERYDVLITDIGLPDGDGLDLHRVLVQDDATRTIALSGYGSAQDVERSRNAGFDRHLTKPVRVDDLLRAIEDLTQRRARAASVATTA